MQVLDLGYTGARHVRPSRQVPKHEDARDCGRQGRQEQACLLQPEYDGSDHPRPGACFALLGFAYADGCCIAEQAVRPERRAPHLATARLFHSPTALVLGVRITVVQPLRVD